MSRFLHRFPLLICQAIATLVMVLSVQLPLAADDSLHAELVFASYIGIGDANNRSVAVDKDGNIYMSGGANDPAWPTTDGSKHQGGSSDVAITKLAPDGKLLWSILLGGPAEDYAYVSAVNDRGELYVSGRAGEGFPTTEGAFDRTFNGGSGDGPHSAVDAFVLKLSTEGKLLYSTYIGGSGNEVGRAIHLLPSGKLIVGASTDSPDLPTDQGTLPGPVLKPQRGGPTDGWVAVVAADGSSLDFLTYFGTNDEASTGSGETLRSLGTDSRGNIWIGGETLGTDLTPTADAFQAKSSPTGSTPPTSFMERVRARFSKTSEPPDRNAYVAKLSPDGRRLVYLSWLGGEVYDDMENEGISDAQGNFYVAGSTASADFPTTPGAFQSTLRGAYPGNTQSRDAYLAKINDDGSLGFVTLFGGSAKADEVFFGPAIVHGGNICATGFMRSSDMPLTAHALQPRKAGAPDSKDAVLACFSPDGTALRYASYFGGSGNEGGRHIAAGPDGRSLVIVGETSSHDLPLKNPASAQFATAWVAKFTIGD